MGSRKELSTRANCGDKSQNTVYLSDMAKTIAKVSDIMTRNVVTLSSEDSLELASRLFEKYDYDGFPVVSPSRKLIGLVTAYDILLQSFKVHLPVVFSILQQKEEQDIDEKMLTAHFTKVKEAKIPEFMNVDPLVISPEALVQDLAKEFAEHHRVNPIPVVDKDHLLLGVVSRYDVIRFFNEQYLHQILRDDDHNGILKRLTRIGDV